MPLYTCKSSGWLIHPAHEGSKFPIRACLSLTCFCAGTADGCLMENLRISANSSPVLYYRAVDFDELHFLKEKFNKHRTLPLSQQVSWNPAVVQEGLMDQGQWRESGTGLSPLNGHSETSAKPVLPCSKFAHSLSRHSSNVSKWNTIKPGRWITTTSESKVTPPSSDLETDSFASS